MPNTENRKNSNKKPTLQEHSQTVIIPQLTPEMLEQARRAAEQGKTAEQIEQEALAAAQAEQKAVESKQEAPTAEKPKTVQPANKPKTRKEAEEELAQNIHDDHLWLNNPVMVRGLGLAPIVAAAVSGQNAWMLCAATILLVTATRMLAVAICHLTGNHFRGVVYSYAAAIVYIPAYIILYNLFGADLSLLGIYLPSLGSALGIILDQVERSGGSFEIKHSGASQVVGRQHTHNAGSGGSCLDGIFFHDSGNACLGGKLSRAGSLDLVLCIERSGQEQLSVSCHDADISCGGLHSAGAGAGTGNNGNLRHNAGDAGDLSGQAGVCVQRRYPQDGRSQQGFRALPLLICLLRRFKPWQRRETYPCK